MGTDKFNGIDTISYTEARGQIMNADFLFCNGRY